MKVMKIYVEILIIQEYEIPFNHNLTLPPHMKLAYGKVQKSSVLIPIELNAYTTLRNCEVCKSSIPQVISKLKRCFFVYNLLFEDNTSSEMSSI